MSNYTIDDLELSFHEYFKAKKRFLLTAKRYCEQNKVDEGQNMQLIDTAIKEDT
jgi:hypothetical protein